MNYKTASRLITRGLGTIERLLVKVGRVNYYITFMVVNSNNYNMLIGLEFLLKIMAIINVEKYLMQIRNGLVFDHVQVLPLNVINVITPTLVWDARINHIQVFQSPLVVRKIRIQQRKG
jgi:hypothetical protein